MDGGKTGMRSLVTAVSSSMPYGLTEYSSLMVSSFATTDTTALTFSFRFLR